MKTAFLALTLLAAVASADITNCFKSKLSESDWAITFECEGQKYDWYKGTNECWISGAPPPGVRVGWCHEDGISGLVCSPNGP